MPKRIALALIVLCVAASVVAEVIPEPNINMVSGTQWPGGDPYLQRQNEPSIAFSTRNQFNLVAFSNDYRTVDVPFPASVRPDGEDTGDAWIGVFKSRDGGQTWRSTLFPGFPQDISAAGMASPLKGFQAAADPVVRAGRNGMFYMTGIVLNRTDNPLSGVFVARYIDNNNKDAGDTISYLGTSMLDRGTSGQFIDKPWIAVAPGTGQCTVNGQTFPAQNVYVGYTQFIGNDNNLRTKLMFIRSTNCGATWEQPVKLSEGIPINQGVNIAVDPNSGAVYVLWRRFAAGNEGNAIMIAKSVDQGRSFSRAAVAANINPFEQGTTEVSIRTNAYPAAAIDATGRLYVAWSQRGVGPGGDARIVMMHSTDGSTWSQPTQVEASSQRGHQFMPSLSVAGSKIVAAYYDLREDHTIGIYTPNLAVPPHFNTEERFRVHEDPDEAEVFTQYVMDAAPAPFTHLSRRHTIDLRAARANAGVMPVFSAARVSRYTEGSRPSSPVCAALGKSSCVEQLQFNPPNLPMFRLGTVPFFGDYIDITGYASANTTVHYAVWTDNRDVRPPANGDWSHYTPPGNAGGQPSKISPGNSIPVCESGFTSSRNQNIYMSRITDGLFVAAPGNAKGVNFQRAFPVFVQNARKVPATYRLSIQSQPAGGSASFDQYTIRTQIDVSIPARSSATRSVFVKSTDPKAMISVNVTEIAGGVPVAGGLEGNVVLNPDVSNPDVSNPDVSNPDVSNPDVSNAEVHNPDVSNPDVSNPDVSNPDVSNPDVSNPDVSNPDVSNPDVSNPDVSNPDVSNPDVSNPDVSNPDVSNPDVSNGAVSDTTWTAENEGNATSGYTVALATDNPPPSGLKTQLIINRLYRTPVARGCTLGENVHRQVIANVNNPTFTAYNNVYIPNDSNATFWLAPGDTARITLRVYNPLDIPWDPAEAISPVVISQAANTYSTLPTDTQPPVTLTVTTTKLPDRVKGKNKQDTATAIGGVGAKKWSMTGPSGLSINQDTGVISGAPTVSGDTYLTVMVTDSSTPKAHTASRRIPLHIAEPITITTTSLPDGVVLKDYLATMTATGGSGTLTWTAAGLPDGLAMNSAGNIAGIPTTANAYQPTFTVTDGSQTEFANIPIRIANPLSINEQTIADAYVTQPYSQQLTTRGGIGPFSWTLKGPSALSLDQSGLLTGTFTQPNSSFVTVTVTDSANPPQTASQQYNFNAVNPAITSVLPSTLAAGFGQLGVFDVTGLSSLTNIHVSITDSNGVVTRDGFLFLSPSTPQRLYVRLPFDDPAGDIPVGPASAILMNGNTELSRIGFTLAREPGMPIIQGFYDVPSCQGGALTPANAQVTAGGTLGVQAFGIDTTETQVRFVQGPLDLQVQGCNAISGSSIGIVALVPVPAPLVTGAPVDVYVRTQARTNSGAVPSAWNGPITFLVK